MKKFLTAAVAVAVLAGTAGAADAQQRRGDRQDDRGRAEQNWDRGDRRDDRQEYRNDRRDDHQEYRQDRRDDPAYDRWQRAERRYNGGRYQAPRGYQTRSWAYGQRVPSAYRESRYVVSDYNRYGLRAPPRGYQYVRSGNDVVLTAVATGLVVAVIASLFN